MRLEQKWNAMTWRLTCLYEESTCYDFFNLIYEKCVKLIIRKISLKFYKDQRAVSSSRKKFSALTLLQHCKSKETLRYEKRWIFVKLKVFFGFLSRVFMLVWSATCYEELNQIEILFLYPKVLKRNAKNRAKMRLLPEE